jgi:hypothetical protein
MIFLIVVAHKVIIYLVSLFFMKLAQILCQKAFLNGVIKELLKFYKCYNLQKYKGLVLMVKTSDSSYCTYLK